MRCRPPEVAPPPADIPPFSPSALQLIAGGRAPRVLQAAAAALSQAWPQAPPPSRRGSEHGNKLRFALGAGDVLIMSGATQQLWQHSVPRRVGVSQPRVNLTFRQLLQPGGPAAARAS
jgi:hypothetical protein